MSRYINPYTDFGFKKLFGEEANKDLLIDFLNQLLPPVHQISDLRFRNNENLGDVQYDRKAFFDIHCTAVSGERFIVEMQKAKVNFFKDRALFYTTFPIREQAESGDWTFELKAVYFVAILDFPYDEEEERRKLLRSVALKDQDGDLFYDKLHFKFVQMPLFNKTEDELETHFDKWLYFLKNLAKFEDIPAILREPIFEKAFHTTEIAAMNKTERDDYEVSRLIYWENNAAVATAEQEGEERGMQRGLEKGLQKGINQMLSLMIPKLKSEGRSDEEIAKFLEISVEQVHAFLFSKN